ncbi:MAG: hypothetical protein QNK37_08245 [Acidobacteriota bacterium]|nr:hypothetical protein [Acidobacteriota bacterium]
MPDGLRETIRHWQGILLVIVTFFGGVMISFLQSQQADLKAEMAGQKEDFIREYDRLETRLNQQQALHRAEMAGISTKLDTMNETLREMAVSLGQLQGKPD